MSFREAYAWGRLLLCAATFAALVAIGLRGDSPSAWGQCRDLLTAFVGGYLLIGGGVGLHGRRAPRRLEDERDIAIARRARGAALFALCFAAYWLAMVFAERDWPPGAITRFVAAECLLALLPFALAMEAATSGVLYWRDRRADAGNAAR